MMLRSHVSGVLTHRAKRVRLEIWKGFWHVGQFDRQLGDLTGS